MKDDSKPSCNKRRVVTVPWWPELGNQAWLKLHGSLNKLIHLSSTSRAADKPTLGIQGPGEKWSTDKNTNEKCTTGHVNSWQQNWKLELLHGTCKQDTMSGKRKLLPWNCWSAKTWLLQYPNYTSLDLEHSPSIHQQLMKQWHCSTLVVENKKLYGWLYGEQMLLDV